MRGNVKLYFRVTNTFKDCTIKGTSNGKVIFERKKRVATPGEMETVLLTEQKLQEIDGEITLSLEC